MRTLCARSQAVVRVMALVRASFWAVERRWRAGKAEDERYPHIARSAGANALSIDDAGRELTLGIL